MNIGIFFNRYPKADHEGAGYLYNETPQFRDYPPELLHELSAFADKAVVVCSEETYQGRNTFTKFWVPSQEQKGVFLPVEQPITLNAVFDKGHFNAQASWAMVNVPALAKLGRDKIAQYKLFGKLQPLTFFAHNFRSFLKALETIKGERAVVKPSNLNGGRGVVIDTKDALLQQKYNFDDGQLLVQEFIDSSRGVGGLTAAVHDLRLYVINGEVVFASVRTPKAGSLVANTSQGGSMAFYEVKQIPQQAIEVAAEVDLYMQQFGNRYYSVDFVHDGKQWYVLEINDRPGVPAQFQSPAVKVFHQKLAACIAGAVQNPLNQL